MNLGNLQYIWLSPGVSRLLQSLPVREAPDYGESEMVPVREGLLFRLCTDLLTEVLRWQDREYYTDQMNAYHDQALGYQRFTLEDRGDEIRVTFEVKKSDMQFD